MSHVASVDLVCQDVDAIEVACAELSKQLGRKVTFRRGQKTWRYYGRWVNDYHGGDAAYKHGIDPKDYGKGEHAISIDGVEYEIGVVKNPNGPGYVLIYDFFGPGQQLAALFGKGLERLKQEYGAQVAVKQLNALNRPGQRPWQVSRTLLPCGTVKVRAARMR